MGKAKARFPDYSAEPPQLKISVDDWTRIEKAYGHPLDSTLRQRIIESTEMLKFRAVFAEDQRIADVEKRIEGIQKRAKALYAAFQRGKVNPSHRFGDLCIEAQFSADLTTNGNNVNRLIKSLVSLDTACTAALDYLDRTAKVTPSERSIWNLWINTLTHALCEKGLPTSARKDSDKHKGSVPSTFVALVSELQKTLPPAYKPSFHSNDALAQAISRARR
jgi:hypothetical protein